MDMKMRIENIVERGEVVDECIIDPQQRQAFSKWTKGFTPKDHPAIIQVYILSSLNLILYHEILLSISLCQVMWHYIMLLMHI